MQIPLENIRPCFEGIIPSPVASCSADGVPNITYVSLVRYVDPDHVALSFQYFNKTRSNVCENPRVQVLVVDPLRMHQYRLDLAYRETMTEGPVFEGMRNKLDGIASMTGMGDVFLLRGVDLYRVLDCVQVPGDLDTGEDAVPTGTPAPDRLRALADFGDMVAAQTDLDTLLTLGLERLSLDFGYDHAMILIPDESGQALFTLASRGYPRSGIGAELRIGEGLIGMAAKNLTPMRVTHYDREMIFSRAVRATVETHGEGGRLDKEIPLPGLPGLQSQLALPMVVQGALVGVLCLESGNVGRFQEEDEQIGRIVANGLGRALAALGVDAGPETDPGPERGPAHTPDGPKAKVKYYPADDSVFIDDGYLIKGLPGQILFKLLREFVEENRREFTNREIRLDPNLQLPPIKDNLETRLILLRRRLEERCAFVRLSKTGRGRFRLEVTRPLNIEIMPV